MATQTISHPVAPPVIPPALPPSLLTAAAPGLATPAAPAVSEAGAVSVGSTELNPLDPREPVPLPLTPLIARMPVDLQVIVPIRDFRVRRLLALAPGAVIETQWGNGDDLPLSSGDVQLAWTEFEVVDSRLAVRVTRLA